MECNCAPASRTVVFFFKQYSIVQTLYKSPNTTSPTDQDHISSRKIGPEDDEEEAEEGHYPATIVAYNSKAHEAHGRYLIHFDDGMVERVGLPCETVRIMTTRVSVCRCKGACCKGPNGGEALPRPWVAKP